MQLSLWKVAIILYRIVFMIHVQIEADVIDYEDRWTSELYIKLHSLWPHARYKHKSYFIFIVQLHILILHMEPYEAAYKDIMQELH